MSLIFRCAAAGWERNAIELGQGYYCDTEFEREVVGPNNTKYKVKTKFVYYPGQAIYSGNSDESSVTTPTKQLAAPTSRGTNHWGQPRLSPRKRAALDAQRGHATGRVRTRPRCGP